MEFANTNLKEDIRVRVTETTPDHYDKQDQFKVSHRSYEKQFFSMYQYRLNQLKTKVDEMAKEKWGHGTKKKGGNTIIHREKILDIVSNEICWVSGTVFCDLHGKLNIFKDVESGDDDHLPAEPKSYVDNDHEQLIMLEDESGRAILHNPEFLTSNILVTGCIIAVLGVEIQAGVFEIIDVVYPKYSPQIERNITNENENKYIAFVSGLEIDATNERINTELLLQFLCGEIGSSVEQDLASKISRLIIAGNSIVSGKPKIDEKSTTYGLKNISVLSLENIQKFDQFLHELLPSIPVTVLPGPDDPSETLIPQPPLPNSLFKDCKQYLGQETLVSNPVWLQEGDNLRILGTSGQNIDDIYKYFAKIPNTLDVMESCIKWQNIAPTAPDTLYCYPSENFDPFILSETPHVFFAGNQAEFGFRKASFKGADQQEKDITLIAIPKFSNTGQIVLMDTQSLLCKVISFQ